MNTDVAPIQIQKLANGRYRWWGVSSVNVRDADGEIFSERAMLADVARTKAHGDDSRLLAYHIDGEGLRIGGAPDWRETVNGHLLESGLFDDTPLGRGFARFFAAHPEGVDGSGHGMSIGFNGYPDASGVYQAGTIKERSILPRSQAAVSYTMLHVKEAVQVEERQTRFLEQMKSMMADPEVVAAAQLMLAANSQSKALDEAGLQRKAAAVEPGTIAFNTGGSFTVSPSQAALGFAPAPDTTKVATNPAVTQTPPLNIKQSDPVAPSDPAVTPPVGLSDTDLSGIAQYIEGRLTEVQGAIAQAVTSQLTAMIPKMISATKAIAADTAQTEVVKAYNEQPASTFDRLTALRATTSKSTVISADHPLYRKSMADEMPGDTEDSETEKMKAYLGFGKKSQNGDKV